MKRNHLYELPFKYEQLEAVNIAAQLGYGDDIIERIKSAGSTNEISRILKEARTREED